MYKKHSIIVAHSSHSKRKRISTILAKRGYKIYNVSDGGSAIRLTRKITPTLVIIDSRINGMNAFDVGEIIEGNRLASVIFITCSLTGQVQETLKKMNLYAYINSPISREQLLQVVEFAIINATKINTLKMKIDSLEEKIESHKVVSKAKGLLMNKYDLTEDEAYDVIRTRSMNDGKPMKSIANNIIQKNSTDT